MTVIEEPNCLVENPPEVHVEPEQGDGDETGGVSGMQGMVEYTGRRTGHIGQNRMVRCLQWAFKVNVVSQLQKLTPNVHKIRFTISVEGKEP